MGRDEMKREEMKRVEMKRDEMKREEMKREEMKREEMKNNVDVKENTNAVKKSHDEKEEMHQPIIGKGEVQQPSILLQTSSINMGMFHPAAMRFLEQKSVGHEDPTTACGGTSCQGNH